MFRETAGGNGGGSTFLQTIPETGFQTSAQKRVINPTSNERLFTA
jgi:hypothetical protein